MAPYFDSQQLLNALKQDRELVCETVTLFCQLQPSMIARLETAISEGNCIEIFEAMHILKSRLRSLYCLQLGDDAEAIERMAMKSQIDEIIEAYTKLRFEIEHGVAAVRSFVEEVGESC